MFVHDILRPLPDVHDSRLPCDAAQWGHAALVQPARGLPAEGEPCWSM